VNGDDVEVARLTKTLKWENDCVKQILLTEINLFFANFVQSLDVKLRYKQSSLTVVCIELIVVEETCISIIEVSYRGSI
jgi:hypothetical protein